MANNKLKRRDTYLTQIVVECNKSGEHIENRMIWGGVKEFVYESLLRNARPYTNPLTMSAPI